jgi:hypothetical protein
MLHLLQISETPVEVQVLPLIIYPHFLMEILANDKIAADLMQLSDDRLPASSSLQRLVFCDSKVDSPSNIKKKSSNQTLQKYISIGIHIDSS